MKTALEAAGAAPAAALIAEGGELAEKRQFDAALARFEEAVRAEPDNLAARTWVGTALLSLNRWEEAVDAFTAVLDRDPASVKARNGLAQIARLRGSIGDAVTLYQSVLASDPTDPAATVGLAGLFVDGGEPDAATALFARAVEASPRNRDLWWGQGDLQVALGRYEQAIASFKRAERIDPTAAETYTRIAVAHKGMGELDDALGYFDRAIDLWKSNWRIHLGKAIAQLAKGDLAQGWRGLEWRNKSDPAHALLQPQWNGQALAGRTVMICGEQQIGDEVMFASCLPEMIATAGRCIVECQPPLAALFARSFPDAEVNPAADRAPTGTQARHYDWLKDLGPIDVFTALGSLPRFLRNSLDAFPPGAAFLVPDPEMRGVWHERLDDQNDCLSVGLWWGGPAPAVPQQGLGLADLLPALDRPDIEFILMEGDFQRHFRAGADGAWKDRISIVEGIAPAHDADEAAALIANLDLLVVPPGLTANLAGALNVPVFTPCQAGDWTHLGTGGIPWFASMRPFLRRGTAPWTDLLTPLVEAVGAMADGRGVRSTPARR